MRTELAGKTVRDLSSFAVAFFLTFACDLSAAPALKPLSVVVSLKDAKACRGARRLNVTIEIQNTSKDPLAVPLAAVGYYYSYLPEPKGKDGGQRTNVGFYGVTPLGSERVVTLEPGGSHRFDANIQLPPDAPPTTTQFEFALTFIAQPPKNLPKGTKVFRGEVQSEKIRFDYSDCAAAGR